MDIQMTYGMAFKVWWSYVWRTFVLCLPVSFLMLPIVYLMMPHVAHGQQPDPAQVQGVVGRVALVWPLLMIVNVLLQVQAMRWMLKTRWSDFRLAVLAE